MVRVRRLALAEPTQRRHADLLAASAALLALLLAALAVFAGPPERREERASVNVRDGNVPARDRMGLARPVDRPESRTPVSPMGADEAGAPSEVGLDASDEERHDPPTPLRPGSGQALLRVQTVALESGAPLAGVVLGLYGTDDDAEEREWDASTQSDPARGVEADEVVTDGAGRGEFIVRAGYAYGLQACGSRGKAGEAEEVIPELDEGEEHAVRLVLPTAWTWHGRVIDGASRRPLAGVEVVAYDETAERAEDAVELARGRTLAGGRIALRLLAGERPIVRCDLPGSFREDVQVDLEATTVDAAQGIPLRRLASLAVHVAQPDGPAAGIDVRVLATGSYVGGNRDYDRPRWGGITDSRGNVEIVGLPSATDVFVELGAGDRLLVWGFEPIQLEPDERREVEYRLATGVIVSGRLIDGSGRPLHDVRLSLRTACSLDPPSGAERHLGKWIPSVHSHHLRRDDRRIVAVARTDADGRFAIDSVQEGSWTLGPDDETLPDVVQPFVIRSGETSHWIELVLDRELYIQGVVLGPDERPVPGALVWSQRTDRLVSLSSGEYGEHDGRFRLGPLPAGGYIVEASGTDAPLIAPSDGIEATAGGPPVVLRMRAGGQLRVTALDDAGHELEDVDVRLLRVSGAPPRELWRGGCMPRAQLEQLLPGPYDVFVTDEHGERVGVQRVVARPHEMFAVAVPMERAARVTIARNKDMPPIGRIEIESKGVVRSFFSEWTQLVPPSVVSVRLFTRDEQEERLIDTKTRTVVAGEEWRIELP